MNDNECKQATGNHPENTGHLDDLGQTRGDVATKAILLDLLEALTANESGVLVNEDPEFLHDFRIAVRRTRAGLGQLKGVFPQRTVDRFAPRFAWLGQITSKPRDFDVYLLGFDELKSELPKAFRDAIEPLRSFLEHHADLAHAELARQINSQRYLGLIADWRKALETSPPKRPVAPLALKPIKEIAAQRIWKLYRRALQQGRLTRPSTPPENIHELRKTCKKLRYMLEFFSNLYPQDDISRTVKQLKKLQDYLGEFQDVHVRINMLQVLSHEMRVATDVPTEALLALGVLLAGLEKRQTQLRKAFADHFVPFSHADNRARFRNLFKPRAATDPDQQRAKLPDHPQNGD